ncbi:MAG TPA: hypothetical protein VI756_25800 [Blastocatellia bacterium]
MSWGVNAYGVKQEEASEVIDTLTATQANADEAEVAEQLASAKTAAKALVDSISGPTIDIGLYGHVKTGENAANDSITVTVSTRTEPVVTGS